MAVPIHLALLTLAAVCSLAACQTHLVISANTALVELDEGRDPEPMYLLKKQYTVTVQCTMVASDHSVLVEPSILWHRAGFDNKLDSRYSNADSLSEDKRNFTSTLSMRRLSNEEVGNYTCTGAAKDLLGANATAQLLSRPLITFSVDSGFKVSDVALWQGDSVNIECIVEGNPVGTVEWFKDTDGTIVSLTNSSMLNLTNLSYERDRGFVSCRSSNIFGKNSAKIFLRIKNPQAYLAPLLIIIGEVIIIGIIVLAYELYMHKKRKSQMESETPQAGAAYKTD